MDTIKQQEAGQVFGQHLKNPYALIIAGHPEQISNAENAWTMWFNFVHEVRQKTGGFLSDGRAEQIGFAAWLVPLNKGLEFIGEIIKLSKTAGACLKPPTESGIPIKLIFLHDKPSFVTHWEDVLKKP